MVPKSPNVQNLDTQKLDEKMPDTSPEGTCPEEDNWRFEFKWGRIKFSLQRNLAFTAVTRAKTSLSVYHSGALPGYLETALTAAEPRPALPTLDEVFEGKA